MNKRDKLVRATYQALYDYNNVRGERIENVVSVQIHSHSPSNIGDDSMEAWVSISGTATMRTSTIIENGITSVVSNFHFSAEVEYTEDKEFKCSISILTKM